MEESKNHFHGLIVILLIIIVAIGVGMFFERGLAPSSNTLEKQEEVVKKEPTSNTLSYSLVEVANHASANDCWMAVGGSVYDVTEAVAAEDHKGGQSEIISGCGKDSTLAFNSIHGKKAKQELEEFIIGTLK